MPSGDREARVPNVAVLLTWFLPGAGHFYIGKPVPGVIALVVIEGLYLLGLQLSGGMTFEYLDPELRGMFSSALSPEPGNLGGFLYQMRQYGYGPDMPRPYPDTIVLGSILCGVSGVLNGFLMAHVHLATRAPAPVVSTGEQRPKHPALLALLAWVFPGAGHFAQGRRFRGALVFVMLVGLFVWGAGSAEFSNFSRERHFYYWAGQFLMGAPALLPELLGGDVPPTHDIPRMDLGLTIACIAGLLNVLAVLDVYGWAESRWMGRDPLESSKSGGEVAA